MKRRAPSTIAPKPKHHRGIATNMNNMRTLTGLSQQKEDTVPQK